MAEVVGAKDLVDARMAEAMRRVLPRDLAAEDPLVRRSGRADFQANAALGLAKQAGAPTAELARELLAALEAGVGGDELLTTAEVSGPGFLNLTLTDQALWSLVVARLAEPDIGVGEPLAGSRVLVDYSGPNIAKELHVGHIRSTVIGDALARVLEHTGAEVIRANHLGDWGTQFGRLIQYLEEHPETAPRAAVANTEKLAALDALYKASQAAFTADAEFADRARARVVALQGGDPATLALWRELIDVSTAAFQEIYERLGVLLTEADAAPESSYNPLLDGVVAELTDKGLLTESDGALCAFPEGFANPEGEPIPLLVRKSDGGYGYAATDLAAIRYRIRELKADRILYVVDSRQAMHLNMVFATARAAGWRTDDVEAVHVPFGTILGQNGRPYKSRSGDTPRLAELLDEAVAGARAALNERDHDLAPEEYEHVVQAAGIGAVKYADLSNARVKDYVFDPARMSALTGNTSVYLQYAHARIASVLHKLPEDVRAAAPTSVQKHLPTHRAERALILQLDEFGSVLKEVAQTLEPHRLCAYLFELAKAWSDFWETCPVIRAESPAHQTNRAALAILTGKTLRQGLTLLGIEAPERI